MPESAGLEVSAWEMDVATNDMANHANLEYTLITLDAFNQKICRLKKITVIRQHSAGITAASP